jgi:hypothetical protein
MRFASLFASSSARYRFWNSGQRSGSWPNHLRSSSLGAISFSHSVNSASLLLTPRGQRRSTSTRWPSAFAGVS